MHDNLGGAPERATHDNDAGETSIEPTVMGGYRASELALLSQLGTAVCLVPPPVEQSIVPPTIPPVLADDISGSFSASTKQAYRSDWTCWSRWCAENGKPTMPAIGADVAAYLHALADDGKLLSTLKRRLATIATAHLVAGAEFDRRGREISFAMKALARQLGSAARHARDELMTDDVVSMLPKGDDLLAARDRALILLGFAGGFRRSELVALDVADIDFKKRDGISITIRRSKTDQEGRGQIVGILYGKKPATCPVRALKAWLAAAAIGEGPIFRPVRGSHVSTERLRDQAVWRAVKRLAAAIGVDAGKLGAHSLRVGHVTQALENGADPVRAKEQLRHRKLDTTLGYNRGGAVLQRDNTSGKLGL